MAGFLRKMFNGRARDPAGSHNENDTRAMSRNPALDYLVLERLLKPRALERVAPRWPRELTALVVKRLRERGEIVQSPLATQWDVTHRVPELKAMLKEHALPVSGTKAILIERLIDAGIYASDGFKTDVVECSEVGRGKVLAWLVRRRIAIEKAAVMAMDMLNDGKVLSAIQIAKDLKESWPTMWDFDISDNPLALRAPPELQEPLIRIILSASPAILGDLSRDDLGQLRIAVAIWQMGFPPEGIRKAGEGFVGNSRYTAEQARMLLFEYANNAWTIERSRKFAQTAEIVFVRACGECEKLNGKVFPIDALPELPNPRCTDFDCLFRIRPIFEI